MSLTGEFSPVRLGSGGPSEHVGIVGGVEAAGLLVRVVAARVEVVADGEATHAAAVAAAELATLAAAAAAERLVAAVRTVGEAVAEASVRHACAVRAREVRRTDARRRAVALVGRVPAVHHRVAPPGHRQARRPVAAVEVRHQVATYKTQITHF